MFEYWQTSRALKQARRLGRRIDVASPDQSLADKPKLIGAARRIKKLFLDSLETGRIEKIAGLFVKDAPNHAEPPPKKEKLLPSDTAIECLRELHGIFDRTKARAFLVSGTFLGCFREQRILAHDYDLDLGVHLDDQSLPALLAALQAHPDFYFRLTNLITRKIAILNAWAAEQAGRPFLVKLLYKNVIHLDFFVHVSYRNEIYHGSGCNLWVNSSFELAPRSFYGMEFLTPADADAYLTENYGDWRTPVKNFEFYTDTPNSRVLHSLPALKFIIEKHLIHGRLGDARRQAILLNRLHQCFGALEQAPRQ